MDIKTTPPLNPTPAGAVSNITNTASPPVSPPSPLNTAPLTNLSEVQKQTFQHIFEKFFVNSGGSAKLPPKQYEYFRNLLENVRDPKNLQMIVEKFKNLEQADIHFSQNGIKLPALTEGKQLSFKT